MTVACGQVQGCASLRHTSTSVVSSTTAATCSERLKLVLRRLGLPSISGNRRSSHPPPLPPATKCCSSIHLSLLSCFMDAAHGRPPLTPVSALYKGLYVEWHLRCFGQSTRRRKPGIWVLTGFSPCWACLLPARTCMCIDFDICFPAWPSKPKSSGL